MNEYGYSNTIINHPLYRSKKYDKAAKDIIN